MPIRVATVRAADVPASQTDFPFFIDLGRVGVTALTLAEAESSRWYTDTDLVTQMAREIVSLTQGHGKYASLTSTSKIAIDYDGIRADLAVGDTYGRNAVWNSNFRAVYHIEASGGLDSTGNGYTLSEASAVYGAAGIGNGLDAGINTQYRRLYRSDNLGVGATDAFTTSFIWKQTTDSAAGTPIPFRFITNTSTNYKGFQMQYESTPRVRIFAENSLTVSGSLGTGANHMVVNRASGAAGTITYYKNAASQGTVAQGVNAFNSTGEISIGSNTAGNGANGWFDEVRVTSNVQTANWITTEYNNQNDEAAFWGTWTTFGGGGGANSGFLMFM